MTYLDVNDFVSNEVLPLVNDIVEDYIESNFYYIENEEDLEDLEEAEVTEELFTDVEGNILKLIHQLKDEYDFSIVDEEELPENELNNIIESAFSDYKDMLIQKYQEKFDKETYFNEYYSEEY